MAQLVVGIGEYKISNNPEDVIKTFALGSCVALMVFDKINLITGMIHIALPESSANLEKSKELPGYFVDTGISVLLKEMGDNGAVRKNCWFKIAGGASITDPDSFFDIGKRNVLAIKKLLWKNNLAIEAEDVGGNYSRTVSIKVATGEIEITSGGKKWNL